MTTRINLVHFGDSITFGQYIDPRFRWTTLVRDRNNQLFADTDLDIFSINQGVSGETTRQALERFPRDVQDWSPDIMTLQFGLNDCNCWDTDRGLPRVSEAAYRANLIEMIDRARSFGARQIILSTNHRTLKRRKLPGGEIYEDANARYSDIVRSVAAATTVTLCDMRAAFEPFDDAELARMLLPEPDVLHLSERGNHVYFETIYPHIQQAIHQIAGPLLTTQGVGT